MSLSSLINNIFGAKSEIDLSKPIFYGQQFPQTRYDREIDEGMSSGMVRFVTLDVTLLNEKDLNQIVIDVVDKTSDYNLCKLIQVLGFTKEDKKYLTISGETHAFYSGDAAHSMKVTIKPIMEKFSVKNIEEYIPLPVTNSYQPTNLGPYGSTGCPGLGISQHPDAKKLRDEGKIY